VKKILLTGSTGFIGSQLLKKLSSNYKIYITLRKKGKISYKNKNVIKILFNNYNQLNQKLKKIKIDYVIHCATHYVKSHKFEDLDKLSESNILFGNIILENIGRMKVKKFINFSSVWENFNGTKDNYFNLYSVYKRGFSNLLDYYKKNLPKIKFYNFFVSDTFGEFDTRPKIINILKNNYKKNKVSKIVSSKLHINLLNVRDIIEAVIVVFKKNNQPGDYNLVNTRNFSINEIINTFNKNIKKRIKIKWITNKLIKERIFKKNRLKGWSPKNSKIVDIINIIKR
jgi:nucleoside-diphosphate-sugar epimerase